MTNIKNEMVINRRNFWISEDGIDNSLYGYMYMYFANEFSESLAFNLADRLEFKILDNLCENEIS